MMGRQGGDQSQLFYLFNLERRIPAQTARRITYRMRTLVSDLTFPIIDHFFLQTTSRLP
jgi:hypothetical protein